jgi:hypothetical protein
MYLKTIKMKKFLILFMASLAVVACDDLNELAQFDVDYSTDVTMGMVTAADSVISSTSDTVKIDESTMEANSTTLDKIDEAALTQLSVRIKDPAGANFNFLKNGTVHIQGEGMDEEEIASIDDVPMDYDGTLEIPVTGIDLAKHVKTGSFVFRVEGNTRELTTQEYVLEVMATFTIQSNIIE